MSWTRTEDAWLIEMLEALPRPWPEGAVRAWLRHAEGHVATGRRYWLPVGVAGQISAARDRGLMPGRRALAAVSGLSEREARRVLEAGGWADPYLSGEDTGPGASRVRPASVPGPSRVAPASVENQDTGGPGSVPGPSRVRPDRARNSARVHHAPCTSSPPTPRDAGGAGLEGLGLRRAALASLQALGVQDVAGLARLSERAWASVPISARARVQVEGLLVELGHPRQGACQLDQVDELADWTWELVAWAQRGEPGQARPPPPEGATAAELDAAVAQAQQALDTMNSALHLDLPRLVPPLTVPACEQPPHAAAAR